MRNAVTARFSRVALASVAVLALTGAGRALWAISSPAEVWQTGYGRALLVKSALLACLVGLGYLNRRRIGAFDAIRRRGAIEIGLLAAMHRRRGAPDRPPAREHPQPGRGPLPPARRLAGP